MKSYYAATTRIRYYGPGAEEVRIEHDCVVGMLGQEPPNPRTWKEPVHEYFANLALDWGDEKPIYAFTKRYGFLGERTWPDNRTEVDGAKFMALQELLRKAWGGERVALEEMTFDLAGDLELEMQATGIDLVVRDLWMLLRVLFLRDYAAGKVKICANPDCPTPYFLQARKGQTYCSHKCAVLINVRRFRERATRQKSRTKKASSKGRER